MGKRRKQLHHATQAVICLKNHGGLPNSIVDLIEHDRNKLQSLVQQIKPVEKLLRKFATRANVIMYELSGSLEQDSGTILLGLIPGQVTVYDHAQNVTKICDRDPDTHYHYITAL